MEPTLSTSHLDIRMTSRAKPKSACRMIGACANSGSAGGNFAGRSLTANRWLPAGHLLRQIAIAIAVAVEE